MINYEYAVAVRDNNVACFAYSAGGRLELAADSGRVLFELNQRDIEKPRRVVSRKAPASCMSDRSLVALRDKFFAFFVAPSTPDSRGGSSGTCTRANYPSSPLKLSGRTYLLQRRIGAPRPPVLPVQQPGMPPSTAELVFKRRVRVSRARRYVTSAPRLRRVPFNPPPPPSPFADPLALSPSLILRYTNSAQCFAMERELASSSLSSSLTACFSLSPPPPFPVPRSVPWSVSRIAREDRRLAVPR